MSDTVIRVENLGKKYIIGHQQQERYTALRDVLANKAKSITQLFNPKYKAQSSNLKEFWALRDVSFEVKRGEVVGIIGHNGAGKSTLLKILSRITEPTIGRVQIQGRVASLLEVGTGFHPELTGRENIFLNGAILGMSRQEIHQKFDEIVEFSEIKNFLDTPVKRYSSGMRVRLAFSVAAHLEPEILIIDEVLAVGDIGFQKKCLNKIGKISNQDGKTVLFVSHNLTAVRDLCSRGILLSEGKIFEQGSTEEVIKNYLISVKDVANAHLSNRKDREGSQRFHFTSIHFLNEYDHPIEMATSGETLKICLAYASELSVPWNIFRISIIFKNNLEQFLFSCPTAVQNIASDKVLDISGQIVCLIPRLPLPTGTYKIELFSSISQEITDWVKDASLLEVSPGDFYRSGQVPHHGGRGVFVDFKWNL